MPVHWHAQLGIHEEKGAEEVLDTVNHHILRQGLLMRAGSLVLVFPPELASHLVDSGFTKSDVGRYVFEGTTRSKKWMKENGLQTWSPASPRLEPVEEGDEHKMYAAAGSPDDVLSVVAGGPAGAFLHIIHPFPGMGFSQPAVSQSIDLPASPHPVNLSKENHDHGNDRHDPDARSHRRVADASSGPPRPGLSTLDGKVIGLYSNTKLNATKVLEMAAEIIQQRFRRPGSCCVEDRDRVRSRHQRRGALARAGRRGPGRHRRLRRV